MWRIAVLHHACASSTALAGLRSRLQQRGLIEGVDCIVEAAGAEGRLERLPGLVQDLLQQQPNVLVALGGVAALAAQRATAVVPILHAIVLEPVEIGLTAPNVSGMTTFAPDHAIRQLKLLEILIPGLRTVACLSDCDAPRGADGINPLASAMMLAARHRRLRMQCVELQGADSDFAAAFEEIRRSGAQALVVLEVPAALARLGEIARLAENHRLPAVFPSGYTETGVVTLGTALHDALDPLAECVVALARGAMMADLPLRRVRTERLVVHVGNARRIGLVVPDAVLRKATEVIGNEAVAAINDAKRQYSRPATHSSQ